MLKFEVNGKLGNKILSLPTNLNEFTPEYLTGVTDGINVADNYSLIALCHREHLSSFVFAGKSNKTKVSTAVVPLFVKCGRTDVDFIKSLSAADKLLITPADVATGLHVNAPRNYLTLNTFVSFVEGDSSAYQNASKQNDDVYFIEFKLVPNCAILGIYTKHSSDVFNSPFDIEDASEGEV